MISNSIERLYVCFTCNNTAKLLPWSGKSTEKSSIALNSQLLDRSVKLMDFERDDAILEEISDLIAIESDMEDISAEAQYSHIYLSVIEQSKSDAKIVELENWKGKGICNKVEDSNQPCASKQ